MANTGNSKKAIGNAVSGFDFGFLQKNWEYKYDQKFHKTVVGSKPPPVPHSGFTPKDGLNILNKDLFLT